MPVNTLRLKKFAPDARRRLHQLIEAKMKYVLNMDSPELREKEGSLDQLKTQIILKGEQTVIEQVAYTWFNRFVALRYMDVRGFQPLGVRIISPTTNGGTPEILSNALSGRIPAELEKVKNTVLGILSGSISSRHPQNEAYSLLLIAACNHLHQIFPFLFEKLDDYTELLLPEDLISGQSIIQFVREGMTEADCQEVEIIGWLYQFYISEWNDELISSKKVYKKNELAPASQLFTPKWIVQYMVDNTLGQLWTEIKPNTNITATLDYYIKPAYKAQL
ncbi:MAG: class I SAM-dependent DNA methyltransferase, partial [Saprospirales bacterium]